MHVDYDGEHYCGLVCAFDRRKQRLFFQCSCTDVKQQTIVASARHTPNTMQPMYNSIECTAHTLFRTHTTHTKLLLLPAFFFPLNTRLRLLLLTANAGWLPLASTLYWFTFRVHRCQFGGKNSMFSKNKKFTVRNARCFANLSIKINLKASSTFSTNYCHEWTTFCVRKMEFSRRQIFSEST